MQLGVVGPGCRSGNTGHRFLRQGHPSVLLDQNPAPIEARVGKGVTAAAELVQLAKRVDRPHAIWLMVLAGTNTEGPAVELAGLDAADAISGAKLARYARVVEDCGDGRPPINAAVGEAVAVNVLSAGLNARVRSREQESFADEPHSAMRNRFSGHLERADR